MDDLPMLLRTALSAVFFVSAVAKLLDRRGTAEAVDGFGVPPPLVRPVARSLPWAELAVALLLLPGAVARVGAAAALLLLTAFTTAVVVALARGRRPECHCFGRLGGSDISGRTVARNGLLALMAVLVVQHPSAAASSAAAVPAGVALAAALLAGEALLGRRAARDRARRAEAAFAADLATAAARPPAPGFTLPGLDGTTRSLADLLDGERSLLLLFLSPHCPPCQSIRTSALRWHEVYGSRFATAVVTSGDVQENAALYEDAPRLPVLLDAGTVRRTLYQVVGTPSAVLVGADGTLASPTAVGEASIRRLVSVALADGAPPSGTSLPTDGRAAAELTLSDDPVPHETVATHEVDDGIVVVDEATGATIALDPSGSLLWRCLDGSGPLSEVVDALAEEFGTPFDVVAQDVLTTVQALGRAGLLAGVAAEWPDDVVDDVHVHLPRQGHGGAPQSDGTGARRHSPAGHPGAPG